MGRSRYPIVPRGRLGKGFETGFEGMAQRLAQRPGIGLQSHSWVMTRGGALRCGGNMTGQGG